MAQMAHMAQVLAKQDSKKDSFAAKFVKQLKKQRDEVAELAKKGDRDRYVLRGAATEAPGQLPLRLFKPILTVNSPSDSQNDEFIKSFNAQVAASLFVLGSSAPRKTSKSTPAADPIFKLCTSHPLYSASVAYGELAQSAIRTYESACEAVDKSKPEHVLGEKWQEENDSLVEILEVGKRVTQREIDRMMMKKGADVEMGDQGRLHEEQEKAMARAVLGMEQLETGNGESGLPWIESMRCAERGAKRLAAGLPMVVE